LRYIIVEATLLWNSSPLEHQTEFKLSKIQRQSFSFYSQHETTLDNKKKKKKKKFYFLIQFFNTDEENMVVM
jgi:hypothetical protein